MGGVGEICGVSGTLETGEGERVPPPRRPHPPWRYPHGPQHGETLEKSRTRLPTRYRHARPAPTGGGGGAPQARVGWGCRKSTGIPKEARAGRGRPTEGHGYPLPQAPAGWGCLRSTWVSLAAGAGGGLPANCVCVARRGETRVTGMTSGEHPGPAPLLGGEVPDLRGGSPVCIRAIARMQG